MEIELGPESELEELKTETGLDSGSAKPWGVESERMLESVVVDAVVVLDCEILVLDAVLKSVVVMGSAGAFYSV